MFLTLFFPMDLFGLPENITEVKVLICTYKYLLVLVSTVFISFCFLHVK